jgi:hypothetical protein
LSTDPDRTCPSSVSAETSSRDRVASRKRATASAFLVLGAIILLVGGRAAWAAGDPAAAFWWLGAGLGLLSMALRPQPLFRRWNDSSELPPPETPRDERLAIASRVLVVAALLSILLAGLLAIVRFV